MSTSIDKLETREPNEVAVVVNHWLENVAPKNLAQTEHNLSVLSTYVRNELREGVSVTLLNAMLSKLGDIKNGGRLEFIGTERQKTAREINEDDLRRRGILEPAERKKSEFDRIDEAKEAKRDKRTFDQRKTDAAETETQLAAEVECRRQIQFYTAMHVTGRIDHAKTQRNRKMLSEFRVWKDTAKTVVDWPGTLFYIKEAISKM